MLPNSTLPLPFPFPPLSLPLPLSSPQHLPPPTPEVHDITDDIDYVSFATSLGIRTKSLTLHLADRGANSGCRSNVSLPQTLAPTSRLALSQFHNGSPMQAGQREGSCRCQKVIMGSGKVIVCWNNGKWDRC